MTMNRRKILTLLGATPIAAPALVRELQAASLVADIPAPVAIANNLVEFGSLTDGAITADKISANQISNIVVTAIRSALAKQVDLIVATTPGEQLLFTASAAIAHAGNCATRLMLGDKEIYSEIFGEPSPYQPIHAAHHIIGAGGIMTILAELVTEGPILLVEPLTIAVRRR